MNFKQLDLLKNSLIDWNVNYSVYPYSGYTINEVLCQFFDAINKGIITINNYTEMVDKLIEWVKHEGLTQELDKLLDKMIADGTFDNIINKKLLADVLKAIEELKKYDNKIYINLYDEGCKLDGVTDDTEPFQRALNKGNIKMPYNSRIKLGLINIPSYRIIDLNGSTVICDTQTLFTCGSLDSPVYTGYFTLKNGFFEFSTRGEKIKITNSIRYNLENLKLNVLNNETTFIKIVNGFNFTLNDIWCGNGLSEKSVNSKGIDISCAREGKQGINNITNSKICNSLIQNLDYGIVINGNNGSIDTLKMDNNGFSKCSKAISLIGTPNNTKTVSIDTFRCEFCDTGIETNGALEINNCRIYETNNGVINDVNGRLTLLGNIDFLNLSSKKGIINKGYLFVGTSNIAFNDMTKFDLGVHTRIYDPLIVKHSGRDFSDLINPFYNKIIFQQNYFELSDLPTENVPHLCELTFYSTGNWNLKIDEGLYYKGFKFGCIKLIFIGKWLVVGDSTLEKE